MKQIQKRQESVAWDSTKSIFTMLHYPMIQSSGSQAVEIRQAELFQGYCEFLWAWNTAAKSLEVLC